MILQAVQAHVAQAGTMIAPVRQAHVAQAGKAVPVRQAQAGTRVQAQATVLHQALGIKHGTQRLSWT